MKNTATLSLAAAGAFALSACATDQTFTSPGTGTATPDQPLIGELMAEAVVPPPGNPAGSGQFAAWVGETPGQLCYELGLTTYEIEGLTMDNFTGAHIHRGEPGVAGPVVVPLANIQDRTSEGCANVDAQMVNEILADPEDFYVQVHTADNPQGAIRAQLKYGAN